jgi:hypothetical protein
VLAAFPQTKRAVVVSLWGAVGAWPPVGPSAAAGRPFGWPWAFINLPSVASLARCVAAERSEGQRASTLDGVGMAC